MSGVLSHYQGKIFSIDSDIKSGKSGEILLIENDAWRRGTLQGEKLAIPENTASTTLDNWVNLGIHSEKPSPIMEK